MAKIFRAIMGEVLPSENLVELEGRERLPSPLELQGKIILKGSFKGEVSAWELTQCILEIGLNLLELL